MTEKTKITRKIFFSYGYTLQPFIIGFTYRISQLNLTVIYRPQIKHYVDVLSADASLR